MTKQEIVFGVVFVVLVVSVVSVLIRPADKSTKVLKEPTVRWDLYSPMLKEKLMNYSANQDCLALLKQYDAAWENWDSNKRRTGYGNGPLMEYIAYHATKAKC